MARRVQIDIIGPRPNEVDISDLSRILDDLSVAIATCIPDSAESVTGKASVSLVDIVEGSDGLVMEVRPEAGLAIATLAHSVRLKSFDDLPRKAHEALYKLSQFATRRNWGLRFRKNAQLGIQQAEVFTPDHVTAPATRKTLAGGTTLLAKCVRVGGATRPKAELRLSNGSLLYVDVPEVIAKELGKRLYEQVVLSGDAVWDAQSGELQEFSVKDVSSFRNVKPTIAFQRLAEAAHGHWDDIDAVDYVQRVRAVSS